MIFSVVLPGLIRGLDRHGLFGNNQFPEFFLYGIVVGINSSPINAVSVICFTGSGNCTCNAEGYLLCIRLNQSGDACSFRLGQGCSIIYFFRTSGCDCCFLGKNLQSAGADVQADAVIVIIRQVCKSYFVLPVVVIICIGFRNADISQACCSIDMFSFSGNCSPDCIQILIFICRVTDNDIVFYSLAWICETSLFHSPVIDIAGPAVRLDTNSYVDFCNFQRTADIPDRIVISNAVCGSPCDYRIARSNCSNTGILSSCSTRAVCVIISKLYA